MFARPVPGFRAPQSHHYSRWTAQTAVLERAMMAVNVRSRGVAASCGRNRVRSAASSLHSRARGASLIRRYRMGQYDEPQAGPQDYDATSRAHVLTSGIVFSPSAELTHALPPVHDGLAKLGPSNVPASSLARMDFAMKAEVAVNEQINVELNQSYMYLALASYFARDNVGLPGFSAHFKHSSDEEREHAYSLMAFQVRRGGIIRLATLAAPQTEFDHAEKGDALYAASVALCLEKLNFGKLRELHSLAEDADDADMTAYIEHYLLDQQSRDVQEAAVLVSQLQRVGKGLGVFEVDLQLQRKYGVQSGHANNGDGGNNVNGHIAVTPLL